jgi:hypothetical protein
MTDLPECLKKEIPHIGEKSCEENLCFEEGIRRAFVVLEKAGWHDKEKCWLITSQLKDKEGWHSRKECPSYNVNVKAIRQELKEEGYWSPVRKQQAKEDLRMKLLKHRGLKIDMIDFGKWLDEVFNDKNS